MSDRDTGNSPVNERRWKVSRHFIVERWRISTRLRVYHGLGHAKFEFVLCLGWKAS